MTEPAKLERRPAQTPSSAQQRKLRALAHHLKPVVLLGAKGLTDEVTRETQLAIDHHELIKVRSAADGKDARSEQLEALASATGSYLIQLIGRTGVLYRRSESAKIQF